jgi:hypothetical protein
MTALGTPPKKDYARLAATNMKIMAIRQTQRAVPASVGHLGRVARLTTHALPGIALPKQASLTENASAVNAPMMVVVGVLVEKVAGTSPCLNPRMSASQLILVMIFRTAKRVTTAPSALRAAAL